MNDKSEIPLFDFILKPPYYGAENAQTIHSAP